MEFRKEKTTYEEVIVELLRKISDKSLSEFRGGYLNKKIVGAVIEEVYVPDSRKEYIQGIEFLSDLMQPKFDKVMKEKYKQILEGVNNNLKKYQEDKIDYEKFIVGKLKLIRQLFQELMIFCERTKYFSKKITYG